MRLSQREINAIKEAVQRNFGEESTVFLFGSRIDDNERGGDIDLLVQTDLTGTLLQEAKFKTMSDIQISIGEQKIDMVTVSPHAEEYSDIVEEALQTGVQL